MWNHHATTNGGIRFDFPVMLQGKLDDRVWIDFGDGGNRNRAVTTNGGVRVRRSQGEVYRPGKGLSSGLRTVVPRFRTCV